MKKVAPINITPKGTLIIQEDTFREVTFEGFNINPALEVRHHFSPFLHQPIEVTTFKGNKAIRYPNQTFFASLLSKGAISIAAKQLEESKVFTSDQKNNLKLIPISSNSQPKVVNYVKDGKLLFNDYRYPMSIDARIESFGKELIVRYHPNQSQIHYLPITLSYLTHQFDPLDIDSLAKFLIKHPTISIQLQGCSYSLQKDSNYKLYARLPYQVELEMLAEGLAKLTSSNSIKLPEVQLGEMMEAEKKGRQRRVGVYKKNFDIMSLIYTKNNLVGVVEDIYDGYNYLIRSISDNQHIKIQLLSVHCPIDDEIGAHECKEFARKNLIGKEVNVFLKSNNGLNMQGSLTRISDGKDVEHLLLQSGYAFVKYQNKGSLMMARYEISEQKAKEKQKGLHFKQLGAARFQDLSQPNSKKLNHYEETRIQFLKKFPNCEEGVIDQIIDSLIYKIRFESKRTIIKLRLDGVRGTSFSPILNEYKTLKEEQKLYLARNINKRSVIVELNDYQKNNNVFIGTLYLNEYNKKSLQQLLLSQSFIYCDVNGYVNQEYMQIQKAKKLEGKRIWSQKLKPFAPKAPLQDLEPQFEAKFSYVKNGQVVYLQPTKFNDKLEYISNILTSKQLKPLHKQKALIGTICCGPYFDQMYRVKIISYKQKKYNVQFIDWGNKELLELNNLRELPQQLNYIQPQCLKAQLDLVKPLKGNEDCLETVRQKLTQGVFKIKKFIGNLINVYKDNVHLNRWFIDNGILRGDINKFDDMRVWNEINVIQQKLRINRIGVWQFSDQQNITSQEEENYDIK